MNLEAVELVPEGAVVGRGLPAPGLLAFCRVVTGGPSDPTASVGALANLPTGSMGSGSSTSSSLPDSTSCFHMPGSLHHLLFVSPDFPTPM